MCCRGTCHGSVAANPSLFRLLGGPHIQVFSASDYQILDFFLSSPRNVSLLLNLQKTKIRWRFCTMGKRMSRIELFGALSPKYVRALLGPIPLLCPGFVHIPLRSAMNVTILQRYRSARYTPPSMPYLLNVRNQQAIDPRFAEYYQVKAN